MLTTDILTGESELDDLSPQWAALADQHAHVTVFQHPGWVTSWWRTFGVERRLSVVVCHEGSRLVGVVPLMFDPGERRFTFVGHPLNDRNGAVAAIEDLSRVWAATATTLSATQSPNGFVAPELSEVDVRPCATAFGARAVVTAVQPSPAIDLPLSWQHYLAGLSPNRIAGWRRDKTRLRADGPISFECLRGEALGRAHLQEFHMQRLRRWQASGRIAELSTIERSDVFVDFLTGLVNGLHGTFGLGIYRMMRGELVIAQMLHFTWAAVILDYMRTFEPSFARFGPGTLTTLASVRHAIEDGRQLYDFGRGDEAYKFVLGAQARWFRGVELPVSPVQTAR